MDLNLEDLQIVVMDCIKPIWHRPEVRSLYDKILQLKFDGYGSVYGSNVISVDQVDFFGTHLVICKKGGKELIPLAAYKSVTLDRCEKYLNELPCLTLIRNDGSRKCYNELDTIVETAKINKRGVSFDYSWAKSKELNEIACGDLKKKFHKDLIMMLFVNHHIDYNIDEMITCGVVKVKTNIFFEKAGLIPISEESKFSQKNINGDIAQIFHTQKFSQYALSMAKEYEWLWNQRIVYSGEEHAQKSFSFKDRLYTA